MRLPGSFFGQGSRCSLFVCLWFAGLSLANPLLGHAAILQDIDLITSEESTEVILRIDEKIHYQHAYLPASSPLPPRCYIDLYGTRSPPSLPPSTLGDGHHVANIRTGSYHTKLRIVLDLKNDFSCSVASSETLPMQIRISVKDRESPAVQPVISSRAESTDGIQPIGDDLNFSAGAAGAEPEGGSTELDTQLSALTAAGRDEISVWGWGQFYSAYDTKKDYAEDDRLSRLQARLGADWNKDLGPDYSLKLYGAIDLDRFDYDSDLADEDTEVRLHETYLQLSRSDYDISFGKQRVRWGKSDQLSPVDSINPQDFRQFITIDLEERALPSWLLRSRWHGASIGLETIIQPWFQESELEYFDSSWALYRNLRQAVIADPLVPEDLKSYVQGLRVKESEPDKTLENMSAGARLTWQTDQTDFAVSYYYGWETLPTITDFPVKNIRFSGDPDTDPTQLLADALFTDARVQAEFKRQQRLGFEWETVLDPVGFRGEIAHIDHVSFLSNDLTSQRRPVTHLVSGIDYTSANEWYVNLQGSWYHIHDYTRDILYFEDNTVSLLGEISKPVWRGNLKLALQYQYTLTDQSSYLRPYVIIKYFRHLEGEVGANIFSGDGETLLGSFDQNDQVYVRARLSF